MQNTFDELIAWAKELKVIYVEDDAALREEVSLFLSDIFARIDTATNGLEGLEALNMNHYDLVITDIRMPEMDGISMIEALKVSHPNIPILVTSAHNESEYLLKLINLGVEHFILKPLEGDQIYRVLHSARLNPARCIFVEDTLSNLKTAKRLKIRTVFLNKRRHRPAYVDQAIGHLRDLT